MRPDPALPPFIPQADGRLQGKKLALAVAIVGGCLVIMVGYKLFKRDLDKDAIRPLPQPTESAVTGGTSSQEPTKMRYEGWDRSATATPGIPVAKQIKMQSTGEKQDTVTKQSGAPAQQRSSQTGKQPPKKDDPPRWLFADSKNVGKSPFGDATLPPQNPGQPGASQQATLLHHAQWEQPADITRTWYMSQGVECLTTVQIVSDIPGRVICRVTRPLEDKFLQGVVLIPQHSLVVAEQAGAPQFGASRLGVTVKQVELPDGTVLALKSKASDAQGASGLTGSTDYHWGRVLAGAGLSALLSIGTRLPTGNQEGFAPTIGQETTQQVSTSVSRTGSQIVQRELNVAPTITIPAGTPVTLTPDDNILLTKAPKVVK